MALWWLRCSLIMSVERYVSEEHAAPSSDVSIMKMESVGSSETLVPANQTAESHPRTQQPAQFECNTVSLPRRDTYFSPRIQVSLQGFRSRSSFWKYGRIAVGIATRLRAGRPRGRCSTNGRGRRFLPHTVPTDSGARPAPFTMNIGVLIRG
jgi:hypothetical protein